MHLTLLPGFCSGRQQLRPGIQHCTASTAEWTFSESNPAHIASHSLKHQRGIESRRSRFSERVTACRQSANKRGGASMRYKPKSIPALHVALGGLPEKMRVELEADIGASPKTVGDLRRMATWPPNLVVITPRQRYPESAVRV